MKTKPKKSNCIKMEEDIKIKYELYNTYISSNERLVKYLCWRYSCCKQEFEDNYIEALTNLYKYIKTYDPKRSIQTWIHISTKRLIHDLNCKYQKFQRKDNQDMDEITESYPTSGHSSEKEVSIENYRSFYNDKILKALDQLNLKLKEAFLLHITGYSLKEIVEITYKNGSLKNPNIETIKSRIHLARKQLKILLTLQE